MIIIIVITCIALLNRCSLSCCWRAEQQRRDACFLVPFFTSFLFTLYFHWRNFYTRERCCSLLIFPLWKNLGWWYDDNDVGNERNSVFYSFLELLRNILLKENIRFFVGQVRSISLLVWKKDFEKMESITLEIIKRVKRSLQFKYYTMMFGWKYISIRFVRFLTFLMELF